MIYLNDSKSIAFIKMYIETAKKQSNKIFSFGKQEKKLFQLQLISVDNFQTIFKLRLPNNIFSITLSLQQQHLIIPFALSDIEYLQDKVLTTIDEKDLIKGEKPVLLSHYPILSFTNGIITSLMNYDSYPNNYNNEFEENSFRTIRYIFLLFILQYSKFLSWGVENVTFQYESVKFKVNGRHFDGYVQIKYNRGVKLFSINYFDKITQISLGARTGVNFDNLVDIIDKQVECISYN